MVGVAGFAIGVLAGNAIADEIMPDEPVLYYPPPDVIGRRRVDPIPIPRVDPIPIPRVDEPCDKKPRKCKECIPPVGTPFYIGPHMGGHHPIPPGQPHYNVWDMTQSAYPWCICEWKRRKFGEPTPPPNGITTGEHGNPPPAMGGGPE